MDNFESTKGRNMEKLNYEWVKGLGSFCGVKLRGNETFDELLKIEKKNMLKGTIICKAKKCNNYLYKNQSSSNSKYCMDCL